MDLFEAIQSSRDRNFLKSVVAQHSGQHDAVRSGRRFSSWFLPSQNHQRDASGRTPVLLAAALDNCEALEALVAAGFPVNSAGQAPLHAACAKGSARAAHILLEAGADVHAQEAASQQTALHFAAQVSVEIVNALLARGADANGGRRGGGAGCAVRLM